MSLLMLAIGRGPGPPLEARMPLVPAVASNCSAPVTLTALAPTLRKRQDGGGWMRHLRQMDGRRCRVRRRQERCGHIGADRGNDHEPDNGSGHPLATTSAPGSCDHLRIEAVGSQFVGIRSGAGQERREVVDIVRKLVSSHVQGLT